MTPSVRVRARPLLVALTACLCAQGCGGTDRGGGTPAPHAIVVGPALDAGRAPVSLDPAPTSGEDDAPFDLVFGMHKTCVRAAGHVHCTADLTPERPLTSVPPMEGIDDAVHLAMGADFGCVVTRAGKVLCFGDNNYGQLGAKLRARASDKPVTVLGVAGAKRVVAGAGYACALLGDGTVRCWGRNDSGQTGSATSYLPAARELVTAEAVEGVRDVTSLATSGMTTCATGRAHEVTCWGPRLLGANDALGQRPPNDRPSVVADLAHVESISGGDRAFCGVRNAEVQCWGETWPLLEGAGMGASKLARVKVTRARRVRASRSHACAVLVDGAVTCWGSDYEGALGRIRPDNGEPLPPELVKGLPSAVDVVLGGSMSCAITVAHEVYCWGFHLGSAERADPTPVRFRIAD